MSRVNLSVKTVEFFCSCIRGHRRRAGAVGTPGCFGASAGAGGALSLGVRRAPSLSLPLSHRCIRDDIRVRRVSRQFCFRSSARVSRIRPFVFHIPRRRLASPLAHSALPLSETRAAFRDTCAFPRHVPLLRALLTSTDVGQRQSKPTRSVPVLGDVRRSKFLLAADRRGSCDTRAVYLLQL